jgi:hypothetical protein
MNEVLPSAIVLVLGIVLAALATRKLSRAENRLIAIGLALQVLASAAQVAITYGVYGSGDMTFYMSEGSMLARAIQTDPDRFGRFWLNLLLQRELNDPLPIIGAGSSTGSMIAVGALFALVLQDSLVASCFAIGIAAFFGKLALYRVFRELLPAALRTRAIVAVFMVPSAVFWSCGLLKEALVIVGLGPVWLGLHRILNGRPVVGTVLVALGALPIALMKPYTLFALTVAGGAWLGMGRLQARLGHAGPVRIRPVYLVAAALLVYVGILGLGQLFPNYSVERLGEDIATHQGLGETFRGGSSYAMGDVEAMSLQKQAAFAPVALATALFRPFIFEANNALALAAALETTVLLVLLVRAFVQIGPRQVLRRFMSTPVLFASLAFVLTFGMGVGLATSNFGTLSRYRMPLIPFYAALVLVLGAPAAVRQGVKTATKTLLPRKGSTDGAAEAARSAALRARLAASSRRT